MPGAPGAAAPEVLRMYLALLHTHNLTRWLVLVTALVAIVWALQARLSGRSFEKRHRIANLVFVSSMDLQLLLGFALYFVSPLVQAGLANMSAAMADAALRFFVVEHATYMIVAVVLAHVGSVMVRRAKNDAGKHGRAILWFGLSLAVVLAGIPWNRALFPGL
ncbi:MAG: hypothetical protein P1P87_09865 [Trueperaceae bacterium]|nr:hypothetical protein [Trueperaceae bacterium]